MVVKTSLMSLALAGVALVGVGCSTATDDTAEETTNTTNTAAVVNTSDEEVMEKEDDKMEKDDAMEKEADMTIAELGTETDDLSTLVAALEAAELVDVFADEDATYTVFAPTNAAFADIQDTVDELLLEENQADLQNVLQYHVVEGAVYAKDLEDGMTVTMLNGDTAEVSIDADGTVMIGEATVTGADVEASNGVVHIIDTVLVP